MVSLPLEPCMNFFHDHIPENGGGDGRSLVTFSIWLSSNIYEKNYSCWSAVNSEWISTERRLLIGSNSYVQSEACDCPLTWAALATAGAPGWRKHRGGRNISRVRALKTPMWGAVTRTGDIYFICINFLAVWAFYCSVPAPLAVARGHSSCGWWAL